MVCLLIFFLRLRLSYRPLKGDFSIFFLSFLQKSYFSTQIKSPISVISQVGCVKGRVTRVLLFAASARVFRVAFLLLFPISSYDLSHTKLKVVANEDTMLQRHCCGHKSFPVCLRAQHLLRTQNLCPRHKNVSDFFQKHFVSATNVSRFAQHRNNHEQQCIRNTVSSFATTLSFCQSEIVEKSV